MIIDPQKQSFQENHKLMIGSIVPRPIALVSTISKDGVNNLDEYSAFYPSRITVRNKNRSA